VSVSRGAAATRGAPDDRPQVLQAPGPLADGEDRRELHGRAREAARRRRAAAARLALNLDETIRERTGRGWEEWFDLLDEWGAADKSHREIARWLAEQQGIHPLAWNAQAIAGSYERTRRGRQVGEHEDGFSITASKTVAVPVERLYDAFVDASLRERWLPDADLRERTATKPRSARFDWGDDGTRVHVTFAPKGEAKSVAAVSHVRLADGAEAERMKAFWRERVAGLKEVLEA